MTICKHIDINNERDCEDEAQYTCMCCNVPVCDEHYEITCPYGGMGYIELEEQ